MNHPICSIIILSFNQLEYTKQCLESIRTYTKDVAYEIIVVDNGSDKETVDYLSGIKDITLIQNRRNLGFAGGCNQGMRASDAKYIMLLNNDTLVTGKWLYNMIQYLEEHVDVSMAGPLTNATVGKQEIAVPYGEDMDAMQTFAATIAISQKPAWRTLRLVAFCILLRRTLIENIGLLDETFAVGNYEDDDFNIRALLAGEKAYICRNSFIHHFMNVSFRQKDICRERVMKKNKVLLEHKWKQMNWNHHAVYNTYILEAVLQQGGREVLHIGCGLGALAIELKERNAGIHVVGIEDHPERREIAQMFVDELYLWDKDFLFIKNFSDRQFDSIIIECILEKSGLCLLDRIKPLLKAAALIVLRVFNVKHITTLERLITGEVEGQLLCASSEEFDYYFSESEKEKIEKCGYKVIEEIKVRKSLSLLQNKLEECLTAYPEYQEESRIYNRIYLMKQVTDADR